MLKNITAHTNLLKFGNNYYVMVPKLIKEFMELNNKEPLNMKYNDKLGVIVIKKEKSVAGA